MDDLTKLRDKWREIAANFRSSEKDLLPAERPFNRQVALQLEMCADELDAALAAVPQDTVEAVREAVRGFMCETWDAEEIAGVDAAIRQALAAQPVRATLTEALDALYRDNHRWSTRPCSTCSAISEATGVAFGCDKMANREPRAALDRQHVEPPATIPESIKSYSANWPVANEEAFERICDLCGRGYKGTQHTCAEPKGGDAHCPEIPDTTGLSKTPGDTERSVVETSAEPPEDAAVEEAKRQCLVCGRDVPATMSDADTRLHDFSMFQFYNWGLFARTGGGVDGTAKKVIEAWRRQQNAKQPPYSPLDEQFQD